MCRNLREHHGMKVGEIAKFTGARFGLVREFLLEGEEQ